MNAPIPTGTGLPEPPKACSMSRLAALLRERGPMTLTEIGEALWGGKVNRQSYARPAGAMVARARRQGIVRQALSMDLGWKRDAMDTARWMLTSEETQQPNTNENTNLDTPRTP